MEVRHEALSTANENEVIIASAVSSLSSCQIKTIHYQHHHDSYIPCMADIRSNSL
ncbi:hypothetical protein ISN45_Aa04g002420, partial [Arabidopsis thaliana x Arabidopsis arenosa]